MPALLAKSGLASRCRTVRDIVALAPRTTVRTTPKNRARPAHGRRSGRESFREASPGLARQGHRLRRLGRSGRHDHPLAERHARRWRGSLLAEIRLFAVLAQVEPGELLADAGLGAERGLYQP